MGAKGIDAKIVIGALIIKHIEAKDDRGTIEAIKEYPYMQYFLGFDHFSSDFVFDPSLFVHIRKRLGNDDFDKMSQIIISKALNTNSLSSESDSEKDVNDVKTSEETPVQESESNKQGSRMMRVVAIELKFYTNRIVSFFNVIICREEIVRFLFNQHLKTLQLHLSS